MNILISMGSVPITKTWCDRRLRKTTADWKTIGGNITASLRLLAPMLTETHVDLSLKMFATFSFNIFLTMLIWNDRLSYVKKQSFPFCKRKKCVSCLWSHINQRYHRHYNLVISKRNSWKSWKKGRLSSPKYGSFHQNNSI